MKRKSLWSVFFIALLAWSAPTIADDQDVAAWADSVLLSTLTVDYTESDESMNRLRPNYTATAWDALGSFLGEYLSRIRNEQLSVHPFADGAPIITDTGKTQANHLFPAMSYWRIYQAVYVPELKLRIAFSMLVVEANTEQHKFVIQSMDMIKKEN